MKKYLPLIYGVLGAVLLCPTNPCLAEDMSIQDTVKYINARIKESLAMPGHQIQSFSFSLNEHYKISYSYTSFSGSEYSIIAPVELLSAEQIRVESIPDFPGGLTVVISCEVNDCTAVRYLSNRRRGEYTTYNYRWLHIPMGAERRLAEKVRNALSHLITIAKEEHKRKDRSDPF